MSFCISHPTTACRYRSLRFSLSLAAECLRYACVQETYRRVASQLQDILTFTVASDKTLNARYKVAADDDVTLVLKDGQSHLFTGDYTAVRG